MTTIESIRLKGFKSFAKPTDIIFGKDYSVILGPNGSGKSNVMDALCFVLGKTSAKSMRAEKSANLIYNGAKTGTPSKEAEVSIVFDNEKGEFPIKEQKIKLTRIVNKTGNSKYLINGETRNRQEVVELLNSANINPDGHNIILQGDIIHIIQMSPLERRSVIEEVSGISVYEEKKEKSLKELEKVDSKLNEAEIILTERKANLRELEKERKQALAFKELESNIRNNKATSLNAQIKERESKKQQMEESINKHNQEIDKIKEKINKKHEEIEGKKNKIKEINNNLEQKGEKDQLKIQEEISQIREGIVKHTSRSEVCENEIKKIEERKQQLTNNVKELESKISSLTKEKISLINKKQELNKKEQEALQDIKNFSKEHNISSPNELDKIDKDIETKQISLSKLNEEKQALIRKSDKINFELNIIKEKIKKYEEESNNSEYKKIKKELANISKDLVNKLNENSALSLKLSIAKEDLSKNSKEHAKLRTQHDALKEKISSNLSIKRILDLKKRGIYGTVHQLGEVNSKYAMALNVAAGPRLNSIVVENDEIASECIKYLKQNKLGIATFLPLNKLNPQQIDSSLEKKSHGLAISLVNFEPKFKKVFSYVFGSTLVIDNLEEARKIGIGKIRMVTLEGDLIESSGAMIGGHRKPMVGFEEKDVLENVAGLEKENQHLSELISSLESKLSSSYDQISSLKSQKADLEAKSIKLEKSSDIDIKKITENQNSLGKVIESINSDIKDIQNKITSIDSELNNLKGQRNSIKEKSGDSSLSSALTNLENKRHIIKEEIIKIESTLNNIEMQIKNMHEAEKEKTIQIIKQQEKEREEFIKEIKEIQSSLLKYNGALKEKEQKNKELFDNFKNLSVTRNKINDEIQKLEISNNEEFLKIRERESTINNISINKAKIIGELEGMLVEFEQFKDCKILNETNLETIKSEIKKFEKMMENIGNVNLRSLDVYDSIKVEYDSLLEKADKLRTEKDEVLRTMNEIESKKKDIFLKTFEEINNNFKAIFQSLSSKDREAFLELEDKNEPLGEDKGLEIKIKIGPNKYLDLKSLSGGEKTMAGLGFIFAIQEYKPASFYLLDEVDAALDKTNSEKLSKLIGKYSEKAQYVVISHNDAIITEASHIYGVSMQKNGISQLISLKL